MSSDWKIPRARRNVIFFGETGAGKSSTINLLLKADTVASVSNDAQPCTLNSVRYETELHGIPCTLWDTRGLGEGSNFFRNLFGGPRSEKELKKLLQERHLNSEIDLLVYCVRGSRATKASLKCYKTFCTITRRLAAPVVIVVTHLEREADMEDWWRRNSSSFKDLKMEFDGYACITSLLGHARSAGSRERLVELLSRKYRWEAKEEGSYFGSPVPRAGTHTASGKSSSLFRFMLKSRAANGGTEVPRPGRNVVDGSGPSSPASSTRYYYTPTESPQKSRPSTPVVQPPTPTTQEQTTVIQSSMQVARFRPEISFAAVPHNSSRFLRVRDPRPSHSEDTDSVESSSNSMFYQSSRSSHTSQSEVHLACSEDSEPPFTNDAPRPSVLERLSDIPYKHLTATIRRKKGYATRSGSFGDIWECELIEGEHTRMVAVKAIKVPPSTSYGFEESKAHEEHEKKFRRELKVWERLQHKNVVPLIGLVAGFGDLPSMVSPWYANGSLARYLALHHEMELSTRCDLLRDIAAGLCYLHNEGVVHGDLHSENILIDEKGAACLTDFGLSFVNDFVGTSYLRSSVCGAIQFADPDLVKRVNEAQDKAVYPTKPCDVYSFGGLVLHVLSDKKPYDGQCPTAIFTKVLGGERPDISNQNERCNSWHQSLIRRCWDLEEGNRPSADELPKWFQS